MGVMRLIVLAIELLLSMPERTVMPLILLVRLVITIHEIVVARVRHNIDAFRPSER